MCYFRNYSPNFPLNADEKLEDVKKKIKESSHKFFIEPNPGPYNCRGLDQNVKLDHLTMRYSPSIGKERLVAKKEEYRKNGYDVREVADCNRSIDYPHMHFIKVS